MVTKTITITEDAYHALSTIKEKKESFSQVILRFTKRKPLSAFFGILSQERADALENIIQKMRKQRQEIHEHKLQKIKGIFVEK